MGKETTTISFFETKPKEIEQETKKMLKVLMEYIDSADVMHLDEMYKSCKYIRYSAKDYLDESTVNGEEKDLLTSIGYTNALLDIMQLYTEQKFEEYEMKKINTKYKYYILKILAERGTLLHKDLASLLGISPSGLTAVIQKMNETSVKVINVEEISKYKLYSLTAQAYKYYLQNKWNEPLEEIKSENQDYIIVYGDAGNYFIECKVNREKEYKKDDFKKNIKGMTLSRYEKEKTEKYKAKSLEVEFSKPRFIKNRIA